MTRMEFTKNWWTQCANANTWSRREPLDLKTASVKWWRNAYTVNNWRLSDLGLDQMDRFNPDSTGECQLRDWECCELYSANLLLELSQLTCPWDMDLVVNQITRETQVVAVWLYGSKENTWMSMCGGNITQFLTTWNDQ